MPISSNQRAYGTRAYGLELDNVKAGWVSDVSGGDPTADVITEKIGSDPLQKKHLGNVKYEEIQFKCGTGMSQALYKWIQTGFNQTFNVTGGGRQNGAVVSSDYDYTELTRLTFQYAIITEFGMPALDAASKDAAKMSLKFKPEITRRSFGQAGKITGGSAFPIDAKKQKHWTPANFRLKIDGLEEPCTKVNKIEALTVKQKITENAVGEQRDYEQEATSVEIPNLVITLAESHARPLYDWLKDFVIDGNCSEDKEKGGQLEYLAPDMKTVLFTLHFFNLGIFKVTADKMEAGAEGIRRVKAELYCENITFEYAPAATFG
jgi:phage tail-like protein